MWSFLLFVAVIYLVIKAFQFNIIAGVIATILVLLYGYFKWYTDYCVMKARAVYSKDPKKALAIFERGYKHRMNIGQLEVYAYYLLREGEVEKSEAIYKKILSQNLRPELRLKVRANYAVLLLKTGRIDEAVEELEEITLNYINTTTYGTLGYLYLLKNNRKKAESFNKEAYDYNSSDPVILDNCVQLYIKLGRFSEAKKYADELIEKKPYFAEGYYDSAYVYMKLGDYDKALDLIEKAKICRITFMSNISEEDILEFEKNLNDKNYNFAHKLGDFSSSETEETEANEEPLEYAYEEETVYEYEEVSSSDDDDENDPFI